MRVQLPDHLPPGGQSYSFLPPSSTFYSSVSLVSSLIAQISNIVKADGILLLYGVSSLLLLQPALCNATALPSCVPHIDFIPEKSCAPGLTDSGSTYCTNTELKFIGSLCSWSTNTALSFIFSVIAALVPSSPTSLLEMSLLIFHLCTCSGSVIQPINHSQSTVILHMKSHSIFQELV